LIRKNIDADQDERGGDRWKIIPCFLVKVWNTGTGRRAQRTSRHVGIAVIHVTRLFKAGLCFNGKQVEERRRAADIIEYPGEQGWQQQKTYKSAYCSLRHYFKN